MSKSQPDRLPELFMKVRDPEKISLRMDELGVSRRELARSAGWRSHTYLIRILNGDIKSVRPVPAARIAKRLEMPIDYFFVTKLSTESAQNVRRRRAA